jgi:putative NADH-flavin reductase
MRIAVFGASGRIGSAVVREAHARGHAVVAAQRSERRGDIPSAVPVHVAHIDDRESVAETLVHCDAVVHAVSGLGHADPRISADCIEPLVEGMTRAGCRRLVVVGTAGTLRVAPGLARMDAPGFPPRLLDEARAHVEIQAKLRALPPDLIAWSYFSPPGLIDAGTRGGSVILGLDDLLFNEAGESFISNEDYAMALIDEIERPRFVRTRFTAVGRVASPSHAHDRELAL